MKAIAEGQMPPSTAMPAKRSADTAYDVFNVYAEYVDGHAGQAIG